MIRGISEDEIDALIPKATEGFYSQQNFIVRQDKVRSAVIEGITNGYCRIYEHDGEFCGFLIAHVHEMLFFDRLQATIVGIQSWKHGAGDALLKDFKEWVDSDPFIRMACWQNDTADKRIDRFMAANGFESSTGYSYIKE